MARGTRRLIATIAAVLAGVAVTPGEAAARSCKELRSLCWTMRDDKNDCTKPYQRCLVTGTFVTPLGRVFKATK
jgi:ABC-type sugar transport system substrate-binding protein